jgi:hypothetical protein
VVGNPTRGNPRESATESRPPMAEPHVSSAQVRVKRCGKSAPASWRHGGSANPTRCKAKQGRSQAARQGPGRPQRWMVAHDRIRLIGLLRGGPASAGSPYFGLWGQAPVGRRWRAAARRFLPVPVAPPPAPLPSGPRNEPPVDGLVRAAACGRPLPRPHWDRRPSPRAAPAEAAAFRGCFRTSSDGGNRLGPPAAPAVPPPDASRPLADATGIGCATARRLPPRSGPLRSAALF